MLTPVEMKCEALGDRRVRAVRITCPLPPRNDSHQGDPALISLVLEAELEESQPVPTAACGCPIILGLNTIKHRSHDSFLVS